MSLATFQAAVKSAAAKYAPQYGLTPEELEFAMLADAHLEGGLGDTAAVGDGGASVGRFQYNTAGGHGTSVMQSTGMSKQQIADDAFQANDWAPILAVQLADVKKRGMTGSGAVAQAIFQAERPAQMYPSDRLENAFTSAGQLTGASTLPFDTNAPVNGRAPLADLSTTPASTTDTASAPSDLAVKMAGLQALIEAQTAKEPQSDDPQFQSANADGTSDFNGQAYAAAHTAWNQTMTQLHSLYTAYAGQANAKDQADASRIAHQNANTSDRNADISQQNADSSALHYQNVDALTKAQNDIDAFFKGRTDSENRAVTTLKGQEDLIKYGTPVAGPQDFSYSQLMGGAGNVYAKLFGVDPSSSAYHVSGTTYIDPQGQMDASDNALGVSGAPPPAANLLTPGGDYVPGATPPPPSLEGAIAGLNNGGDNGMNSWLATQLGKLPKPNLLNLPPGYGATAGLADATSPQNAPSNIKTLPAGGLPASFAKPNLLQQAGLKWDKAPALFNWG